jgi:hypothetical protein
MSLVLPDPKVPKKVFRSLPTELALQTGVLAEVIQPAMQEERTKRAQAAITRVVLQGKRRNSQGIPIPLTEEEAKATDQAIDETLARIKNTRSKASSVRGLIDQQVSDSIGKAGNKTFALDLKDRPTLRRAARNLFGFKVEEISYDMYKQMLTARSQLEKSEGSSYSKGEMDPTSKERK